MRDLRSSPGLILFDVRCLNGSEVCCGARLEIDNGSLRREVYLRKLTSCSLGDLSKRCVSKASIFKRLLF